MKRLQEQKVSQTTLVVEIKFDALTNSTVETATGIVERRPVSSQKEKEQATEKALGLHYRGPYSEDSFCCSVNQ